MAARPGRVCWQWSDCPLVQCPGAHRLDQAYYLAGSIPSLYIAGAICWLHPLVHIDALLHARASICKVRLSQCSVGRRCEAVRALKRKLAAKPNAAHAGRLEMKAGRDGAGGIRGARPGSMRRAPLSRPHFRKSPSAQRQEPAVSSWHVCTQTARRVSSARSPCAPLRAVHIAPWRRSRAPRRICGSRTRRRRPAEPRRAPCRDIACDAATVLMPHNPSLARWRRLGQCCAQIDSTFPVIGLSRRPARRPSKACRTILVFEDLPDHSLADFGRKRRKNRPWNTAMVLFSTPPRDSAPAVYSRTWPASDLHQE